MTMYEVNAVNSLWQKKNLSVCCASNTDIRSHCSSIAAVERVSSNSLPNLHLWLPPGYTISSNFYCRHPTWRVKPGCPLRQFQSFSLYPPKKPHVAPPWWHHYSYYIQLYIFDLLSWLLGFTVNFVWLLFMDLMYYFLLYVRVTQTILLWARQCIHFP